MSISPASRRGRRALSALTLLLCLLAAAGCAARGRSAAVPTATAPPTLSPLTPTPTATPTLPRTAVSTPKSTATPRPTFTPTVTPTPTAPPTPTVTPTATVSPTFNTLAAPDQTVLQSLAAAWSIDGGASSDDRIDAMQPYCLAYTPRENWWVCTNDDGRVTALHLSAVQAGGSA